MREKYKSELDQIDDVEELILDSLMQLPELSESDKQFLEKFTSLTFLSMNGLGLKSLKNLPALATLVSVKYSYPL